MIAYVSIPTRPPAEAWVHTPAEDAVNRAYQTLRQQVDQVEYLIGFQGDAFAFTDDVEGDLLSIAAVRPMRREAVRKFLTQAGSDWSVVQRLIDAGQLVETNYQGRGFYLRKLPATKPGRGDMKHGPAGSLQ